MRKRAGPLGILFLGVAVAAIALAAGAGQSEPARGQGEGSFSAIVPLLAKDFTTATVPPGEPESFEVVFLDVGQGDSILVTVGGEHLLIDAGPGGGLALSRLLARGITDLDAILATHPDDDHVGGFEAILDAFEIETIYINGGTSSSDTYVDFMAAVDAEGAQVITLRRGDTIPLGGLEMPVLHPPAPLTGDLHEDSIVTRLNCGSIDVLFTGDVASGAEASMLAAGLVTDVDVLKVANHGSDTSSTAAFLAVAKPTWGVISAGLNNEFGDPDPSVLARLIAAGASIQSTDTTDGDDSLVLTSNCRVYSFSR